MSGREEAYSGCFLGPAPASPETCTNSRLSRIAQFPTGAATQPPTASRLEPLKLYTLQAVKAVAGSCLVGVS